MGGGTETEAWLLETVDDFEDVSVTVYSVGSDDEHDNPPVHARLKISKSTQK